MSASGLETRAAVAVAVPWGCLAARLVRRVLSGLLVGTSLATAGASAEGLAREETLKLALQERVRLPGADLEVHFVGYRDDRCPEDVRCIQAGEARAFLWVEGAGVAATVLTLPWSGSDPSRRPVRQIGRYRFDLESLEPRPHSTHPPAPQAYRVALRVRW